jgi:chorismate-pyruvate lyase
VTAPGTPSLPRLLRHNPDTVTHLLEELTGEPLVADVRRQHSRPAEAGNTLGVGAGQTVTHRIAVLKGGVTSVPYVYAESAFVPARLPDVARLQLEQTRDPIGRILAAHGLAYVREESPASGPGPPRALDPIGGGVAGAAGGAAGVAGAADIVWSRAYILAMDGQPVFSISEWFFRSVEDALERSRPA